MKKNALASLALAFATAFALADNLGTATKVGSLSRSSDYVYTADQADAVFATRVPTSRTVNGKALSANVTLSGVDISATAASPTGGPDIVTNVNRHLTLLYQNIYANEQNLNNVRYTAEAAVQSVKISGSATELKSGTTATIPVASTSAAGVVQLSADTNGSSTTKAATESAVKDAISAAKSYTDSAVAAGSYTHPSYTARTGKPTANASPTWGGTFTVSQIKSDATGHVTDAVDRTITIPNAAATTSAAGLMSAADKTALDSLSSGAVTKASITAALQAQGISSADAMDNMDTIAAKVAAIIAVLEAID